MAGKWLPLKPVQTGTAQFLWSIKLQWCDFSIFMIFFFFLDMPPTITWVEKYLPGDASERDGGNYCTLHIPHGVSNKLSLSVIWILRRLWLT